MAAEFLIVIPVYDGVDLLDVAAPREMFSFITEIPVTKQPVRIVIASEKGGIIVTRDLGPAGMKFVADASFADIGHVDLLWVPGGDPKALKVQFANPVYMDFLKRAAKDARYVTSVCEGALLLAEAGLLKGYKATTHWAFLDCLRKYEGVTVLPDAPRFTADFPRFVVDDHNGPMGIRVTGGGISSGLDESLELIRRIAGADIASGARLFTQYFPNPPVDATIPLLPHPCKQAMG